LSTLTYFPESLRECVFTLNLLRAPLQFIGITRCQAPPPEGGVPAGTYQQVHPQSGVYLLIRTSRYSYPAAGAAGARRRVDVFALGGRRLRRAPTIAILWQETFVKNDSSDQPTPFEASSGVPLKFHEIPEVS